MRNGGVVAYPTDTAYGLAADPTNQKALKKIFAIKGRREDKPSPLIAASFVQAAKIGVIAGLARKLARKHWPGPLTIVLPLRAKSGIAALARGRDKTVAVRVPASPWARALADGIGRPITSTSANRSGNPPAYSGLAVKAAFRGKSKKLDIILDAGVLKRRRPSTIARIHRGKVEVVRQGDVIVE